MLGVVGTLRRMRAVCRQHVELVFLELRLGRPAEGNAELRSWWPLRSNMQGIVSAQQDSLANTTRGARSCGSWRVV